MDDNPNDHRNLINIIWRPGALPGDLQGRSRHVDDDDDWRSSMNDDLKTFNEWKSLTGVGE